MAENNNTSTGDQVKAPKTAPPAMSIEEQLGHLKLAVQAKIHEFVDQANQAANDPSNMAFVKRDLNATTQDAANSITKALTQLGDAFRALESMLGKQTPGQTEDAATGGGQSALRQGIAKVHDALSAGMAVANQKLQEGPHAVAESIGQTAAAVRDGIRSTWEHPQTAQTATPTPLRPGVDTTTNNKTVATE